MWFTLPFKSQADRCMLHPHGVKISWKQLLMFHIHIMFYECPYNDLQIVWSNFLLNRWPQITIRPLILEKMFFLIMANLKRNLRYLKHICFKSTFKNHIFWAHRFQKFLEFNEFSQFLWDSTADSAAHNEVCIYIRTN